MIKVAHLNKYFNRFKKNEIHVLNDISLEFPEKGLVVLLGPSGSGKTTLLNVLGGLDKVQAGVIDFETSKIEGYDAGTWDKIRNEAVGYIFQNYNLLPELSVFDNIAFVLKMIGIHDPKIIEERVNYMLNAVNMYPFRKKRALQLSGGQQQRVAIARALVKNPRIIIADEPTGNLDSKNTLEIMNIIKQISQEKLVVLVTHEKEMATFYGDRIIELKDGQIVNDYNNAVENDHKLGADDAIYLKDLREVTKSSSDRVNLEFYQDSSEDEEPISVRLIIKNKTLYLDVDSSVKKIKLIDASSGVVIKDEHYVKKTREELIETTFDSNQLNNDNVHRESKLLVSIKQTLFMALQKVLKTSRKGKLMLFSFFVAGIVIAFTISILASVVIIEPEANMQISKGYVSVESWNAITKPTYTELMAYGDGDDAYYINTLSYGQFNFVKPNGNVSDRSFGAKLDLYDQVKSSDLLIGRLPTSNTEMLVSKSVAESIVKGSSGQEIGIWTNRHLLYESVAIGTYKIDIVGIVDTEITLIYLDRDMANLYMGLASYGFDKPAPHVLFDDIVLLAGALPQDGQVLISNFIYSLYSGGNNYAGSWPKTLPNISTPVSGVYDVASGYNYFFYTSYTMERLRYENENNYYYFIRSSDPKALLEDLESESSLTVRDVYQSALTDARAQRQIVLLSSLGIAGFIIGFALVGFYFIIRSSLISRIYEISVYRALGVKKNEIFRSFLIEIFVLTTISTLIGYVLGSTAISYLQDGLLGQFNFFKITPLSFIFGLLLMYLINVLAGLFPVYMLLRKTPAQILSQYDI